MPTENDSGWNLVLRQGQAMTGNIKKRLREYSGGCLG